MLELIYQKRALIGGALVLIIVTGAVILLWGTKKEKIETANSNTGKMIVDIEGAVNKPGIYQLDNGSIIQDAINLSGGFTENADLDKIAKEINRADILNNNQKLYFPFKATNGDIAGVVENTNKINLNLASLEQLDSLPGIGTVYAQRIIDFRIKNGNFSSVEEIMEIQGIGEKTFEKIKDLITI